MQQPLSSITDSASQVKVSTAILKWQDGLKESSAIFVIGDTFEESEQIKILLKTRLAQDKELCSQE